MAECPLEHHLVGVPSFRQESVREDASPHPQLSVRGGQVFDRLRVLLPTHLRSQPTSRVSPFPPALLFSICDALQPGRADSSAEQNDTSVLPSVLDKLRDWRLLDPEYRYSPGGLHRLALNLAGITDGEAFALTNPDLDHTSPARLRIKWVSSDSHSESQDREPSSSTPPSPSRSSVLDSPHACAHALLDLNEHRSDAVYGSCQAGRLGTPASEDASAAVVSRRLHSVSGFRSGCTACRHPRISGPSTPPRQQMASLEQRTPFGDVTQFDTHINIIVSSPRHPKLSVPHTTPKKTKREKHKSLQSISCSAHVDENEPPPLTSGVGVQQGINISFPRQRTHYSRISNALSSSPAGASVERRVEPSHLSNRTRKGDKHTFSHRVASVDLRLPMGNRHSPYHHASPIDLHPHAPTRAHSFSYTAVNSHGLGSVAARVQKLSSNALGSRSSKRLPSWSHHPPTTTTTTTFVKPTSSLSPSLAKTRFQNSPPYPYTRLRPSSTSIPPRVPSAMTHCDRRSVSSQTHPHTGSPPSSPLFHARKWQV